MSAQSLSFFKDPLNFDLEDPDLVEGLGPSGTIYHYTTPQGLVGIIDDKLSFYATHHRYLNDGGEISFGRKVALGIICDLHVELPEYVLERVYDRLNRPERSGTFVACFSESPRVLSQWRAYAANGRGYCLGLKMRQKHTYAEDPRGEDFWLDKLVSVIYGEGQLRKALQVRFKRQLEFYGAGKHNKTRQHRLAENLIHIAETLAARAKHRHFREEREWRIVVHAPTHNIKYRPGPNGLVPYLMTVPAELEQVWVGPNVGPDPKTSVQTTKAFLAKNSYKPEVKRWESTFRG